MTNQKVKLTKTAVAEAEATGREYVLWDNRLAGFGLRVRPSGAKSFIYLFRSPGGRNGQVRRLTLRNSHPDRAYEEAQQEAAKYCGGRDSAAEKSAAKVEAAAVRAAFDVAKVLDSFITEHAKPELAPKTAGEYERLVEKVLKPAIGSIAVEKLDPSDVAAMRDKLRGTPTQATQAVRVLSSALSWASEAGLRSRSPNPARIRLKGSRRRTRLFSDGEVYRLHESIDGLERESKLTPTVALGLRLLFATGCRAGEICSLQWSNVDLSERLMRWPRSKTGFLEKPITAEAAKLLKQADRIVGIDWVCPSSVPRKALRVETLEAGFERVMKKAKVEAKENASLHLIRHWFATRTYTDKTIPLPVQMAIVGHSSVATAMRYAHVARDEMKRAAEAAAKRRAGAIRTAGKRTKANVVELAR